MYPFPVSFRHLERMTDGTGLLEHCLGRIPRRKEGYTTDDNARALWVCVEWFELVSAAEQGELFKEGLVKEKLLDLIDRYLAFLLWVQRDDGSFHNNIGYNRTPEPEEPSDDCLGRTLWACAVASVKLSDAERRIAAEEMFVKGIEQSKTMKFPRGWAYALAACSLLLQNAEDSGRPTGRFYRFIRNFLPDYVTLFESKLVSLYQKNAGSDWSWFEPVMTYGNGVLPWSLFHANKVTERQDTLEIAKESLHFLIEKMTDDQGVIRPIGNRGWCTQKNRSDWDQQPLEVMKLALASAEGYLALGEPSYLQVLEKCRGWFHGENDLHISLANPEEGSCCDGLTPEGPNLNQGAESTLSYLLTEAIYRNIELEADSHVCIGEQ
ncbi:glycosyl transferase [Effusibacillus consociatus]|uniref:Glycosyl transferase n=1 Tax=Effusibacillus consociatus TaxID=1117041 RepID=A0ABV9Q5V8_9BACL